MATHDLVSHFEQQLIAAGGEFHRVESLAQAAQVVATHTAVASGELVVPLNFARREPWGAIMPILADKGVSLREAGNATNVADAPAGLSNAELAIAETGSVLIAENALAARAVSMLTLTHFVLVLEQDLVPLLEDAGVRLQQLTQAGPDQRHHTSLVTGPSRTADIERTLTIGVQGPKTLCVIMVT